MHRALAALVSVLLHALLLVVMMRDPPITTATQQARAGSSGMRVTLLDQTLPPSPAEPVPPVHKRARPNKPKAPRAIERPPPIPIDQATVPMPAEVADTTDPADIPPDTAPEPSAAPRDTAKVARPAHVWGQPPGMSAPDDNAIASAALAAKLGSNRGRSDTAPPPVGPDMGVDGFQVFYELANETRLRAWRAQGMTELFLPMPGSLRLMVCPLEVALRRGSSACRMVDPDSPQLKVIGDARDVINIRRVYHLGDVVWSGPGPYR
ncbi:type II toxin-antitoxin system RelE/ParE family toxin [Dokdonella sp.]|uniref:type II toxin-antitoxin system RelE/ParE family toxin n=1 Tax=Dokdonella sp. TaxID=2291710 RepID=UPI003784848A